MAPVYFDRSEFEKEVSTLELPSPLMMSEDITLLETLNFMQEKRIPCLLLHKNDKLTGVITERDFLLKIIGQVDNWRECTVSDYMTKKPITVKPTDKIIDVVKTVTKHEFRHLPVVNDDGKVVSIISVRDLLALLVNFFKDEVESAGHITQWNYLNTGTYSEDFSLLSGDSDKISSSIFFAELKRAMQKKATCIDHQASVQDALVLMQKNKVGSLLVMEYETKIVGIITERDLMFNFFGKVHFDDIRPVTDYMTPSPHVLLHRHYLAHAINNMAKFRYRNTIVVNEDKYPIALVGLLEVFRYISLNIFKD